MLKFSYPPSNCIVLENTVKHTKVRKIVILAYLKCKRSLNRCCLRKFTTVRDSLKASRCYSSKKTPKSRKECFTIYIRGIQHKS